MNMPAFKTAAIAALALLVSPSAVLAQDAAAASLPDAFGPPAAPAAAPVPAAPVAAPADARAEPALRAFIDGAQKGQIDTSGMTTDLQTAIGAQSAQITPLLTGFGAVRTVTHLAKQDGADLFGVVFDTAATQWIVGFNAEGKIGLLLFRPAPTAGAAPAAAPTAPPAAQ